MLDIKLVVKMDRDEEKEMDIEETFGPGISSPLNPAPETEIGVGGLGEMDDDVVPNPDEGVPLAGGDSEEPEW